MSRATGPTAGPVIDVQDVDFEREVIERSRSVPVVVDFWAPWCAPCRQLGPLLERLADEHAGAFVLAKVNVDESPRVASGLEIRSIPAVLGFRDGRVVTEFTGAQPETVVRRFLASVLPSEADRLVTEGESLVAAGHLNAAEERFRSALAQQARHARAALGLARVLAARGADDEAMRLVESMLPGTLLEAEGDRLAAEIRTRAGAPASAASSEDESRLRAALVANERDLASRLALARSLAAAGHHEEALEHYLACVKQDAKYEEEAARRGMLDLFAVLGSDHDLVQRYRSQLARAFFK